AGLQAIAPVSGVPAGRFDPAADTALRGDHCQWLNRLLPDPPPPACPTCHQPMRLPPAAPVFWTCPACHPSDDTPGETAELAVPPAPQPYRGAVERNAGSERQTPIPGEQQIAVPIACVGCGSPIHDVGPEYDDPYRWVHDETGLSACDPDS